MSIDDNLTTGYAHSHYSDGTPIPWADGISNHISRATITNNDIVDPTDVGIVIFSHNNDEQGSTASNNVIVHAGHSACGSLGFDAHHCTAVPRTACGFSGRGFTDNLILRAGTSTRTSCSSTAPARGRLPTGRRPALARISTIAAPAAGWSGTGPSSATGTSGSRCRRDWSWTA